MKYQPASRVLGYYLRHKTGSGRKECESAGAYSAWYRTRNYTVQRGGIFLIILFFIFVVVAVVVFLHYLGVVKEFRTHWCRSMDRWFDAVVVLPFQVNVLSTKQTWFGSNPSNFAIAVTFQNRNLCFWPSYEN